MFLEKVYSGRNQWYFYVFSLLIIFTAIQIASIPLIAYMIFENPEIIKTQNFTQLPSGNIGLALMLFTFVVGFFATFFCAKYLHGKKYIDIVTARPKVDWSRILFATGLWGILTLIATAISLCFADTSEIIFQFDAQEFFILAIIALLMLPFQIGLEELVFRGYLMQWSALLFKYRWVALLITSVLFGLMHLANPEIEKFGVWVALPQYILMGLILGFVTIKDDGIELALGLHFGNNLLAALTFTHDSSALQTHALFKIVNPTASWMDTVVMLVAGVIFIWICDKKYHFMRKVNLWKKITPPVKTEYTDYQEN